MIKFNSLVALLTIIMLLSNTALSMSEERSYTDISMLPNSYSEDSRTANHQWILDKMVKFAAPGRKISYEYAQETEEEARIRYNDIVNDLITVVYDPKEEPLFNNKYGRAMTLAILASILGHESGYMKNVDLNLGNRARGDSGASWCMAQINLGKPVDGTTPLRVTLDEDLWHYSKVGEDGWSGQDLIQDRQKCLRVSLHMVRRSWKGCSKAPVTHRLAVYASGKNCSTGVDASINRVSTAQRWLSQEKPPLTDTEMMNLLSSDEKIALL